MGGIKTIGSNISSVRNTRELRDVATENIFQDQFFQPSVKKIYLYVIGVGNVGKQFVDMVENRRQFCIDEYGVELCTSLIANSKKYLFEPEGLSREQLATLDEKGQSYQSLKELTRLIKSQNRQSSIVIDNTAAKEVSDLYKDFFDEGISVVTCNKVAGSSPLENYQKLMNSVKRKRCKFQYETSVGAALPIIKTIQNLRLSGDKIRRIDAVVSGSLNFIFNNYDGSRTFAEVVKQAQEEGYTEPDPRIDLSGLDVIRKILILSRESGYNKEIEDVHFESFLPKEAMEVDSVDAFFRVLKENEEHFQRILKKAQEKNAKLKVTAQFIEGDLIVSLKEVTAESPFYQLDGKDNIVALYTEMYPEEPLIVKGAGAGARVTASGVFSDLLYVANQI